MISIIDYGAGNIGSIKNMIKKIGLKSTITRDIDEIKNSTHIILPGVGSFDYGMNNLKNLNLKDILNHMVLDKKVPFLGICLGMQLITKSSEEGDLPGLGWIDAEVIKFKFDDNTFKIPHMGWNFVEIKKNNKILSEEELQRFYFVHSFHVKCNSEKDVISKTNYNYNFVSAINKDNIYGVQFQPEKSHKYGKTLLDKFLKL